MGGYWYETILVHDARNVAGRRAGVGAGVYQLAGGVAGNAGVYGAGDYSKAGRGKAFF